MSYYYEPWSPKVGTRVRTRITTECRADHNETPSAVGVVTNVDDDDEPISDDILRGVAEEGEDEEYVKDQIRAYDGHRFWVTYDTPVVNPKTGQVIKHELCAAIELEPEEIP